ncbi:hypothetical protein [Streptomyces erythrochromogenes]|uniref:hypothetical protein n=1 Tax=Streptomyces erythrochromogenes TaxID=285574 RepID=UPI00380FA983
MSNASTVRPNWLLAVTGCALLVVGLAGFFLTLNTVVVGVLLPLGTFLVLMAAFAPFLEGKQELPGGGSINLRKTIIDSEDQIADGDVVDIRELM